MDDVYILAERPAGLTIGLQQHITARLMWALMLCQHRKPYILAIIGHCQ